MKSVTAKLQTWNRKIDAIWEDSDSFEQSQSEEEQKQNRAMQSQSEKEQKQKITMQVRFDLLFVFGMGILLFYLAWILPFNEAPDEQMRYLIPTYIFKHGTLPSGWDEEVRNSLWGISYAFHPILPYIFGGYLMKVVGLFGGSEHALLMAARSINVLLGMGFYWYVVKIARELFQRRLFRIYFIALLALLPQLLYLFVYVNTDGIALFSTAMIVYGWLEGLKRRWDRKSCTTLAVGVSVCALSYFNAYGFALFSIILFIGSLILFNGKKGAKLCTQIILKRGLYITAIVFLLCGWWFIRCAILYDGDFLGLNAPAKCGELYAQEEYKPSVKKSLQEQGVSLEEMLKPESEGGMEWVRTTYRSTIGYFGYLKYPLGIDIYSIHKRLLLLGALGCICSLLFSAGTVLKRIRTGDGRSAEKKEKDRCFLLLQISLGCCIIIPVLLSLVYSYTDDFQPQGRYIMPLILPLMYFAAAGTQRVVTLLFRKWVVYLVMIALFYAVFHVFFAAFVSVYIPTFVDSLEWMSEIRFPWFSNQKVITTFLSLFIPG